MTAPEKTRHRPDPAKLLRQAAHHSPVQFRWTRKDTWFVRGLGVLLVAGLVAAYPPLAIPVAAGAGFLLVRGWPRWRARRSARAGAGEPTRRGPRTGTAALPTAAFRAAVLAEWGELSALLETCDPNPKQRAEWMSGTGKSELDANWEAFASRLAGYRDMVDSLEPPEALHNEHRRLCNSLDVVHTGLTSMREGLRTRQAPLVATGANSVRSGVDIAGIVVRDIAAAA